MHKYYLSLRKEPLKLKQFFFYILPDIRLSQLLQDLKAGQY